MAALAATAATTLVASLATDGWERAKSAMGGLWRRVYPDRADAVEADLVDIRAEVLAARAAGDEQAEQVLADEWRSRLRRLLASDPRLAPYFVLATERFLTVPDPKRAVLEGTPKLFTAVRIRITEPSS